jgi:hypothetical protein
MCNCLHRIKVLTGYSDNVSGMLCHDCKFLATRFHLKETFSGPHYFDRISNVFRWSDLFPEWIDKEEVDEGPSCPKLPMLDLTVMHGDVDMVVDAWGVDRGAQGRWGDGTGAHGRWGHGAQGRWRVMVSLTLCFFA